MARWTARKSGIRFGWEEEECDEREVNDESSDERELRLEVDAELNGEWGGEGEGEAGGDIASESVSLGIGPKRLCWSGVR